MGKEMKSVQVPKHENENEEYNGKMDKEKRKKLRRASWSTIQSSP